MRIAIISDLHANATALEAVLQDIEKREVDEILCAGDLVGYGPHPNEVVKRIRTLKIRSVQGNYDDAVANARLACGCDYPNEQSMAVGTASLAWTIEQLDTGNSEFLRRLPPTLRLRAGNLELLLAHGSPRRLNEYLYEDAPEEQLKELFREAAVDVLIVGHTHQPYHRQINGQHLINAGSVGQPRDGDPRACYVLAEFHTEPQVKIVRVSLEFLTKT